MSRFLSVVLLVFVPCILAQADERILSFVSDVTVLEDGSLNVVESITVKAEGKNIKRGIYRDLPNSYPHPEYGKFGFNSKTPINVGSLSRNGKSETWHSENLSNGERIFFGHASRRIKPGTHKYELSYSIQRQIAKDKSSAVFYWNVTGNGWQFPIDSAHINIKLPSGASIFSQEAWTGRQGSTASNVKYRTLADGGAAITTSSGLSAYEGLTVKLTFDATLLSVPAGSKWQKLYQDNRDYAWGMALLLAMLVFYSVMWWLTGRDPALGIIVARYRPLEELSAAAHRAIYRNSVDDTSFAVGVLSAAIKGHLQIHKKEEGVFRLDATTDGDIHNLAPSELLLVNRLFSSNDSVTIGEQYNSRIKELRSDYEKLLKAKFAKPAHVNHLTSLIIGMMLGLLGLGLIYNGNSDVSALFFPFIFGGILIFSVGHKLATRKNFSTAYLIAAGTLVLGLFSLFKGQPQFAVPLMFFGSVLGLFTYLLPAPKVAGQKLINKIEGFKLYLSKAEHESLKRLRLPEKTPQLYEQMLPFAIALDLETEWSDQFVTILANAHKSGNGTHYNSGWYHGSGQFGGANSFAPALAAGLASSVVAASTPPSSSSSGSGGFSGGGGGGGGGGGW